MKMKMNTLTLIASVFFLLSCGEEVLTGKEVPESFSTQKVQSFEIETCAGMNPIKPPVDILYVIDNSKSTLAQSFNAIKSEIQSTLHTISNDFSYHIYLAPLHPSAQDNIQAYPLLINDPQALTGLANVNITDIDNVNLFKETEGNNEEYGFQRVRNLINYNRSNGIFRKNAHTIVVMVSNGNDTESLISIAGNKVIDSSKYNQILNEFKKYTSKYAENSSSTNNLNARTFRFFSLVAHQKCHGWQVGSTYKKLSQDLYEYQNLKDNSTQKDSLDLCSKNYSSLFSSVNNSIQKIIDGYKYNYWKISSASESQINTEDITLTKIKKDGSKIAISPGTENGFEYVGHKVDQKITYEPSYANERATGLLVKLNGSARVSYPDCLIAKTKTPTEYFGYVALTRAPKVSTIKVRIDDKEIKQSQTNGWSYIGMREILNIKVPGPENVKITPPLNKSGFFIKLHGDAIYTNGQSIKIFYRPESL